MNTPDSEMTSAEHELRAAEENLLEALYEYSWVEIGRPTHGDPDPEDARKALLSALCSVKDVLTGIDRGRVEIVERRLAEVPDASTGTSQG